MKLIALIIVVTLAIVLFRAIRSRQIRNGIARSQSAARRPDPSVYLDLRDLALHSSPEPPDAANKPNEPFSVIMDWGLTRGTATVAALADGTASVYLSSGGGFIGGGQSHESIRRLAKQMVKAANEAMPLMKSTSSYPLPRRGQVTFYARASSGIFTTTTSEEELSSHQGPLSKLGDSAQAIITEYRQIEPGDQGR